MSVRFRVTTAKGKRFTGFVVGARDAAGFVGAAYTGLEPKLRAKAALGRLLAARDAADAGGRLGIREPKPGHCEMVRPITGQRRAVDLRGAEIELFGGAKRKKPGR